MTRPGKERGNWWSRAGLALLSAAADWRRGAGGPVLMMGVPDEGMACCHLALPNTECNYSGSKANFTCPSGFHRQYWLCCEGTRQAGCGECTTSTSTCWSGSFNCSIWWWSGASC